MELLDRDLKINILNRFKEVKGKNDHFSREVKTIKTTTKTNGNPRAKKFSN